ncbi:MAG: methylmalonyl-CoA mutase family protein [Planctomycetes bacterium]|nr:methylmalonyl-CoA mutase family protein [Planctomycetota bacterium]MCP4770905.1 methylmalonyl-CoA mutase family protein [Planctomycetota bacterium]MCP4862270.1 methylmalonyl-CoA mutase family protein [Planctomycetota bacterium]
MTTKTESVNSNEQEFSTANKLRFVTAASLFDGHDAAINIMRRILQQEGAEVIHLGHNRSVEEIVESAIEEDAQGIAISSYQGGHVEFFKYMVELLAERGCSHIRVFGGGGGTITDSEIKELHAAGVERLYSVEDGRLMGLVGMIRDMLKRADFATAEADTEIPAGLPHRQAPAVAQTISIIEKLHDEECPAEQKKRLEELNAGFEASLDKNSPMVLGITGTGGAGKSSLTDELVRRFLDRFPARTIGILSVDPSRRRTGGALLGDRIRMNAAKGPRVFMRSMATRRAHAATSESVRDSLLAMRAAGYDLVILETAGIGQSDSAVTDLCDMSLYVMTPEFGAPTQLEKIDMLDFADGVVLNKADKRGAEDARREVAKTVQRNRQMFETDLDDMPVFLTAASRFGDLGVDELFQWLMVQVAERTGRDWDPGEAPQRNSDVHTVVPSERIRYLSEISAAVRKHKADTDCAAELAGRADSLARVLREFGDDVPVIDSEYSADDLLDSEVAPEILILRQRYQEVLHSMDRDLRKQLAEWHQMRDQYAQDDFVYQVRGREVHVPAQHVTLSGLKVPKVSLPKTNSWEELAQWFGLENLPGHYPYTAGVFPFKRAGEDPTRMFAGEGTAERTNRRFHYVSHGQPAVRLSTAFDSVTLYGEDPAVRPDILGKVGNAGVSICSLDDAKRLYSGFDLCAPTTSVSMTINGPAPMMLAFFLNAAIDQLVERRLKETGRWEDAQKKIDELCHGQQPTYRTDLPPGHDGFGLGTLGVSGDKLIPADEYAELRTQALQSVRGTVQADILKEDQAQNTCIFSTEFALKIMGDVQEFFVDEAVRNFYSVSISGYHIAEAGANPISQLAFTLANGFTFVEYYLARGMDIDSFAPNLSFFFSNGIDAEYSVIGRVARRIWAVAMKNLYGGADRSQKLKYHIQTSGRSLHAQEIDFNDIRTTLQALYAIYDNCQSLHTNAYDEAITTPTEESVRRALAIQLIINRELGEAKNENPLQGSFIIEELTELVEEAVLAEFDRLTDRGGVLGAMETMYQRGKIQEESMKYEMQKHSGELPIVGVNTFLNPHANDGSVVEVELIRSSDEEKDGQVAQVAHLHELHRADSEAALIALRNAASENRNVFAEMMEAVKVCTLGQISHALYDIGGQYRRNM